MVRSHTTTTLLLGLTAAVSLLLCSTALPASVRHSSPSSFSLRGSSGGNAQLQQANSHQKQQEPSEAAKNEEQHGPYPLHGLITRHQSPSPSLLSSSSLFYSSLLSPLTPSVRSTKTTTTTFQASSPYSGYSNRKPHHQGLEVKSYLEAPRSMRDQILHQCTTHFLELLDSEISDKLVARLSRLITMLPVVGVETRAVMRNKVVQVMQQVTGRFTNYETIRRVIRTAVDDAGLLPVNDNGRALAESGRRRRGGQYGVKRIQYKELEDADDEDNIGFNSNRDDDLEDTDMEDEDEDKNSAWFQLPIGLTSTSSSRRWRYNRYTLDEVDESQIPVVTELSMEAVLNYMSEILAPALVIHQLTEGIQDALQHIGKVKALRRSRDQDSLNDNSNFGLDLNINSLGSQTGAHHSLDLLNDDWVGNGFEGEEEDINSDSRGQDEDLWDQDMEIHNWDSTGHLFEDFEETDEDKDSDLDTNVTSGNNVEQQSSTRDEEDGNEEEDGSQNPYVIGIQDDDSQGDEMDDETLDYGDNDERDGSLLGGSTKQNYFNRFRKRSLPENEPLGQDDEGGEEVEEEEEEAVDPPAVAYSSLGSSTSQSTSTAFSKRSSSAVLSTRRPDFAPDPRLEMLLAQLINPLLTAFIDEDFPASCKSAQGELMDRIIWSLDQSEQTENNIIDQDQLALLAELEF